jgi:formylglycine-generating enzyme required for sulfatase activity
MSNNLCLPRMSEREALKLPSYYVSTQFESISEQIDLLRKLEPKQLVSILEGTDEIKVRYAAGALLALIGDPRFADIYPHLIDIPRSSARMGSDLVDIDRVMAQYEGVGLERKWLLKEVPRHDVVIGPYRISKYQVTNWEYLQFLRETGHPRLPSSWILGRYPVEKSNHPVFNVYPEDAAQYLGWLSKRLDKRFRLPTEAEWEFAAAGIDGLEYPWGNQYDRSCANTAESNILSTTPVGMYCSFGNSVFGICDMAGNVEEYVSDLYTAYPGGSLVKDHLNSISDVYHVARGGSFGRFGDLARCARRHGLFPEAVRDIFPMGFRVACDE